MFHGLPPIEAVIFEGATLLMEDRLVPASLRIENGQITGLCPLGAQVVPEPRMGPGPVGHPVLWLNTYG